MMTLNLLAHPLRARVIIDIAPDLTRRVYVSKMDITRPQDVTQIVEAIIWSAVDLAQRHGITLKGFTITPPPPTPPPKEGA